MKQINGMNMFAKYLKRTSVLLLAALVMSACEGSKEGPKKDAREAFVGDYSFVSTGSIDLYAGALKVLAVPMNEEGFLSIALADEENAVWMIVEKDSSLGHVAGDGLFLEPTTARETFKKLVMDLSFTYGKATLQEDTLSFVTNVDITATYSSDTLGILDNLAGKGQTTIVATKL